MSKCVKHSEQTAPDKKWWLNRLIVINIIIVKPTYYFKKYLNTFIYSDLAWQIIYLNETISLGKAWVLHKVKHLKCQLMPQPEKHKALKTYNLASVTDIFTLDGPIK